MVSFGVNYFHVKMNREPTAGDENQAALKYSGLKTGRSNKQINIGNP